MLVRQRLEAEFAKRRLRNPCYSLRAFARDLRINHSTLSQILRARRGLSERMVATLGQRLRLEQSVVIDACVQQNAETILRLARSSSFRPNSRWIASRSRIPVDSVNAAVARLLQ